MISCEALPVILLFFNEFARAALSPFRLPRDGVGNNEAAEERRCQKSFHNLDSLIEIHKSAGPRPAK